MANKLIVIGAGGCAQNVIDKSIRPLKDLGDGFSEVEFHFIDTSRNDYHLVEDLGELYRVEKSGNVKGAIEGSAGDRTTNATDIANNVPLFLDKIKLTKQAPNTYVCVISSASGGTGSTLLISLCECLMEKNIPCFAVLVGDNNDSLRLRNTQAVLATLNAKATRKQKCLLTYYINNSDMDKSQTLAEAKANEKIKNAMCIMSLFLSGCNESIDAADMSNFINQQDYKLIKVPYGIYSLTFHSGNGPIELPVTDCIPTVARTLTRDGVPVEFSLNTLHHKIGKIISENALGIFVDSSLPIHIVASSGLLKEEIRKLSELNEISAQRQNDLKSSIIAAPVHAVMGDDEDSFF